MSLLSLVFCLFAGQLLETPPPTRPARVESFVLFERGRVWRAERQELGSARMSAWSQDHEASVELLMDLVPIETKVQRVLRTRAADVTFTWREWRVGQPAGAEAGRTLVLEHGARGTHVREWAGRAMRSEVVSAGRTTLELVEEARLARGFWGRIVPHFDALEVRSAPAAVVEMPLAVGFVGAPRVASILPLDGGMRASHWVFAGRELVAFVEGEVQGSRRPVPKSETVAMGAPGHQGL